MNILYLSQILSSSRGGAPLLFCDLAKAMARRGHNVHIICNLSTENISDHKIVLHLIRPYLKESHQLPPSITQNLRYIINSIVAGSRIIKENDIDIIHTNSWTPVIAGSILGRLAGLPVISAVVDVFSNNEFGGWSRWAKFNNLPPYHALAARLLERISLIMPTSVFHTISKTSGEDILNIRPSAKIEVVYPGIDTSQYTAYREKVQFCDIILFIGRLVYYKNVDILIKAFRKVTLSVPHAKLVIIGEGPMKRALQTMVSDAGLSNNVCFLGNISTSEKIGLLSKCSALALPSLFEGFGLVILEAFAMAKPVLVSDVKPFNEIVEDGTDGFIIPRNDPLLWSHKMEFLLLNKDECKRMGTKGLPKAYEKFSLERSIEQMQALYDRVILECHIKKNT